MRQAGRRRQLTFTRVENANRVGPGPERCDRHDFYTPPQSLTPAWIASTVARPSRLPATATLRRDHAPPHPRRSTPVDWHLRGGPFGGGHLQRPDRRPRQPPRRAQTGRVSGTGHSTPTTFSLARSASFSSLSVRPWCRAGSPRGLSIFPQHPGGPHMDPEQCLTDCETALHAGRLEQSPGAARGLHRVEVQGRLPAGRRRRPRAPPAALAARAPGRGNSDLSRIPGRRPAPSVRPDRQPSGLARPDQGRGPAGRAGNVTLVRKCWWRPWRFPRRPTPRCGRVRDEGGRLLHIEVTVALRVQGRAGRGPLTDPTRLTQPIGPTRPAIAARFPPNCGRRPA